jgi:hypothetical protein
MQINKIRASEFCGGQVEIIKHLSKSKKKVNVEPCHKDGIT